MRFRAENRERAPREGGGGPYPSASCWLRRSLRACEGRGRCWMGVRRPKPDLLAADPGGGPRSGLGEGEKGSGPHCYLLCPAGKWPREKQWRLNPQG